MAEAFQACRAASQSISVASNGGQGSQEAADACSPCRQAIRHRHSTVDEGRGGRVVARHLYGSTPFEVYTDNNPLTYVLTTAKLDACGQRWVAKLANYNFTIQYRSGQSNVEAGALSRILWPKVLDGTDTVDVENMDTHIVNAIITGARSKSSLIESISSSPEIVPKELISDSNEPSLDWFKLQRADPSLATIIHLMESDQLYKRKTYKKDSADVKSLLRIKKSSFD